MQPLNHTYVWLAWKPPSKGKLKPQQEELQRIRMCLASTQQMVCISRQVANDAESNNTVPLTCTLTPRACTAHFTFVHFVCVKKCFQFCRTTRTVVVFYSHDTQRPIKNWMAGRANGTAYRWRTIAGKLAIPNILSAPVWPARLAKYRTCCKRILVRPKSIWFVGWTHNAVEPGHPSKI